MGAGAGDNECMSIRVQLAILLFASLALSLGFLFFSGAYLEHEIARLIPAAADTGVSFALHELLVQQIIAMLVVSVLLSGLLFVLIANLIARPLRSVVKAMEAFALRGERIPMKNLMGAPSEILRLCDVFNKFTASVEESHKRDVEISRVKSDFISTAAHQFRTPLTGIRWALEALEKESLTDTQKALVESAREKSRDLVSIVTTLLDISAIESGKYAYKKEYFDMAALVERIAKDFSMFAQQNNVSLYYAKDGTVLPKVNGDPERIKWILTNLIENAIQYTPAGGSVRIHTETGTDRLYVRVRDTGIGIQPEDRANIFERFYRASNAVSKQNQGNGLGLYIARTIATDHGGDLNFAPNTDGPGTTFSLSLPAVVPAMPDRGILAS